MGKVKVHVWTATIDVLEEEIRSMTQAAAFDDLHPEDRARLQQIVHAETRAEFVLGRRLVRIAAHQLLNRGNQQLRLQIDDFGKPSLPSPHDKLQFSITHSHGLVMAAALVGQERIGIDCELIRPEVNIVQMAQECMSESELLAFNQLPKKSKQRDFFRLWTQKESFLKAIGKGLLISPKAFEVHLQDHNQIKILDWVQIRESEADWSLIEHDLDLDYACCVAVERRANHEIELIFHNVPSIRAA